MPLNTTYRTSSSACQRDALTPKSLVVGHDSRNLADGTGGPQDPAVLFTAAEVAADLAGSGLEIEKAGEVLRPVDGRVRRRKSTTVITMWNFGIYRRL